MKMDSGAANPEAAESWHGLIAFRATVGADPLCGLVLMVVCDDER